MENREMQNETASAEKMAAQAATALQEGERQIKTKVGKLVCHVDKHLHENPWPVMAGVASSCLFVGFLCGLLKSRS